MGLETLAVIGAVITVVKSVGYTVAGSYVVRIGIKYVQDYKESVSNERG